jgi:hypothetical protein
MLQTVVVDEDVVLLTVVDGNAVLTVVTVG